MILIYVFDNYPWMIFFFTFVNVELSSGHSVVNFNPFIHNIPLTHFRTMFLFYTLLERWENQRFCYVFRGFRVGKLAWNGLRVTIRMQIFFTLFCFGHWKILSRSLWWSQILRGITNKSVRWNIRRMCGSVG